MITTPTTWLIRHGESEGNIGAITHSPSSIQRIDSLEQRLHEQRARWVVVFTHGYFIKGVQHRRENPAAEMDASLMASFRDSLRLGLTANTGELRFSPIYPPHPTP